MKIKKYILLFVLSYFFITGLGWALDSEHYVLKIHNAHTGENYQITFIRGDKTFKISRMINGKETASNEIKESAFLSMAQKIHRFLETTQPIKPQVECREKYEVVSSKNSVLKSKKGCVDKDVNFLELYLFALESFKPFR
ncbi:MAG: hypothetical protein A3B70_08425 [Deltaproteobacteria bacterium RIFCSPHIGHO2_02_FULL_40_11]|nr:MAG: hypothetical protein A3B70_08425 [Deltaproteobacteria bacterium RIFCSPHIGHO2_02_FULL_40_11]